MLAAHRQDLPEVQLRSFMITNHQVYGGNKACPLFPTENPPFNSQNSSNRKFSASELKTSGNTNIHLGAGDISEASSI